MQRLQAIELNLREDPKFAQLSYNDQLYVRMVKYGEELKTDEDFQKLNAKDKAYVMEQLSVQAPVLLDKNAQVFAERLYQQYKADPQARSTLTNKSALKFDGSGYCLKMNVHRIAYFPGVTAGQGNRHRKSGGITCIQYHSVTLGQCVLRQGKSPEPVFFIGIRTG